MVTVGHGCGHGGSLSFREPLSEPVRVKIDILTFYAN